MLACARPCGDARYLFLTDGLAPGCWPSPASAWSHTTPSAPVFAAYAATFAAATDPATAAATLDWLAAVAAAIGDGDRVEEFTVGKASSRDVKPPQHGMQQRFARKYREAGYSAFVVLAARWGDRVSRAVEDAALEIERGLQARLAGHPAACKRSFNVEGRKAEDWGNLFVVYLAVKVRGVRPPPPSLKKPKAAV